MLMLPLLIFAADTYAAILMMPVLLYARYMIHEFEV